MPSILICDDSQTDRANLRRILRASGYEVEIACSGGAALECIRQSRPQMLFLDVNMPDIDGLATLRIIRKDPEFRTMPIVMVSGKAHKNTLILARMQGANGYVVKPYTDNQIREQLGLYAPMTPTAPTHRPA
jgi:CheY-like chemotaxis protein